MPTIVFASPKGGVGKSTAAVLLATELAGFGAGVSMIDADPNKPLSRWAKRPGRPAVLEVISDVTEDSIIDVIETAVPVCRTAWRSQTQCRSSFFAVTLSNPNTVRSFFLSS
ncbi:MAG: ParA family protein [Terriglobales bacterium]